MASWLEQEATNEAIFREMNEWSKEMSDGRLGTTRTMDSYLCECSDARCTDPISLTRTEYEAVRAVPIRFAIALDHENPEIDRVVTENRRFATVEKLLGVASRIARGANPRR